MAANIADADSVRAVTRRMWAGEQCGQERFEPSCVGCYKNRNRGLVKRLSPNRTLMRIALLTISSFLIWCGCASPTPQAALKERTLAPGDRIILDNRHRMGLESHHVVDTDGDITLPYLGKVHVRGLSLKQAELRIEKAYVDNKIYIHPVDLIVLPDP